MCCELTTQFLMLKVLNSISPVLKEEEKKKEHSSVEDMIHVKGTVNISELIYRRELS